MQGTIPPFWETLIKRYLKETFYPGTRKEAFSGREDFTEGDYRFFAKGVGELSRAFTQERASLSRNYLNRKELRSGYLLYFLPVNALKAAMLLRQGMPRLPSSPLRVLDIGSGSGTGMLGTLLWIEELMRGEWRPAEVRLEWDLVDQNRNALSDAANLHREVLVHLRARFPEISIESDLRLHVGDLSSEKISRTVPPGERDLILVLNFLGELPPLRRRPLVETVIRDFLSPMGRLLIMEPALQKTTRDLMTLRDEIVSREAGFVEAPCLHQAACPMRSDNRRDWCHTYLSWERPAWIEKIDRLVGIRKDYLKCSYMIFAPMGGIGVENRDSPPDSSRASGFAGARRNDIWRVVSGPLNSKGKSERLLCGPEGLPHLLRMTRLDRDESGSNRDFHRLERGDLVRAPKISRIGRQTVVTKV